MKRVCVFFRRSTSHKIKYVFCVHFYSQLANAFFMPYYTGQTVETGMACRHLVITPFVPEMILLFSKKLKPKIKKREEEEEAPLKLIREMWSGEHVVPHFSACKREEGREKERERATARDWAGWVGWMDGWMVGWMDVQRAPKGLNGTRARALSRPQLNWWLQSLQQQNLKSHGQIGNAKRTKTHIQNDELLPQICVHMTVTAARMTRWW